MSNKCCQCDEDIKDGEKITIRGSGGSIELHKDCWLQYLLSHPEIFVTHATGYGYIIIT